MKTNLAGASATLVLTAAVAGAGARAQEERVLTVEQTAIQAVQAPARPAAANPLGVVAWVDADNTYAAGERVGVGFRVVRALD